MIKEVVINFDYKLFLEIVRFCKDNDMEISDFVCLSCLYTLNSEKYIDKS